MLSTRIVSDPIIAEKAPVASTMRPTSNSPDNTRGAMMTLGIISINRV